MEKIIKSIKEIGKPLKVTIIKGSNWNSITSIDFGGADVTFSGCQEGSTLWLSNHTISSITNCNIQNDNCYCLFCDYTNLSNMSGISLPNITRGFNAFLGCPITSFTIPINNLSIGNGMFAQTKIENFELDMPNLINATDMFYRCYDLKTFIADVRSLNTTTNMFNYCSALTQVEITTKSANSGWTQSTFNIPSNAPCNAYKYVDDLGDGLVRLVFTSEERFKYKVTIGSDNQSALDAIVVAEDLDNNNTNVTI